jgi:hypothetical protein
MICDDPAVADSAVVNEEFISGRTINSVENSNPDLTAASLSDASGPPAVKKPRVAKVCSRGKCVEGQRNRFGTITTFTAKADDTFFKCCDQCHFKQKTVYDPKMILKRKIETEERKKQVLKPKYQESKDKRAAKRKKKADDARAERMCPGTAKKGCPSHSPQIPGRSYCTTCQVKVNAHNSKPETHASVIRSQEKAVIREQNIIMSVSIVTSLKTVDVRALLPSATVEMLKDLTQFIVCDSENKLKGNYSAAHTYEWVFRDFATGSVLHLKRYYKNWNFTRDSAPTKLISDAEAKQMVYKFVGDKTLMYFAGSKGCDYKRLLDWYGYKDLNGNYNDRALSFKWFNLDYQVTRNIFGLKGAIITPTCKLLTLYQSSLSSPWQYCPDL